MSKLGIFKVALKDLYMVVKASKAQCLHNAGKDVDEQMFAIEKDEEYLPEFKTCVKDIVTKFQDARNTFAEANPKRNVFRYDLNEDQIDFAINTNLRLVMLEELKDSDMAIYEKVRLQTYYGTQEEAAGGDDAGGDDDE